MSTETARQIGLIVRNARRAIPRMTQARLAGKAHVTRETIYRLERGRMATPDVLSRVFDALSLDRDELRLDTKLTDGLMMHPELTLLRDRRRSLGLTLAEPEAVAAALTPSTSNSARGRARVPLRTEHRPPPYSAYTRGPEHVFWSRFGGCPAG